MDQVGKPEAIIIDLDGTLANIQHRLHHITANPKRKNWAEFNSPLNIRMDSLNEWCARIVRIFHKSGHKVLFVSGRQAEPGVYEATKLWILQHVGGFQSADDITLMMRKNQDFRVDHVVKLEIYRNEIEPKYNVLFCVDDRKQVVDMWRAQGLTCLQCAEGEF